MKRHLLDGNYLGENHVIVYTEKLNEAITTTFWYYYNDEAHML